MNQNIWTQIAVKPYELLKNNCIGYQDIHLPPPPQFGIPYPLPGMRHNRYWPVAGQVDVWLSHYKATNWPPDIIDSSSKTMPDQHLLTSSVSSSKIVSPHCPYNRPDFTVYRAEATNATLYSP